MSPVPIIERQRGLAESGQIRCGDEKRVSDKGKPLVGKKLETFRLTSQHRDLIEAAAERYSGAVKPWESPDGPAWQVVTEESSLPCLIVVNYSLTLLYEKWEGATKPVRRCDGVTEELSGGPCVCNATGQDECDIITRLMVVLPELGTTLGWKLRSTGENAARELAGSMELADGIAGGRPFVPAILRLTQRRSVTDGQPVRFVVPVLDLQLRSLVELGVARAAPQLEATSVVDGLAETARRAEASKPRTARSQEPLGERKIQPPSPRNPPPVVDAPRPEPEPETANNAPPFADKVARLMEVAGQLGVEEAVAAYVTSNREEHEADGTLDVHGLWLDEQIALAESKLVSQTVAES